MDNGFKFYEESYNHYTYIKDDIEIVVFAAFDSINVDLTSGYQASHYED